jgi:hypothetical protein
MPVHCAACMCFYAQYINDSTFCTLSPQIRFTKFLVNYTDKKENKIFLIYKEIQSGAVAKSYMINGLLIYGEIFVHFLIY